MCSQLWRWALQSIIVIRNSELLIWNNDGWSLLWTFGQLPIMTSVAGNVHFEHLVASHLSRPRQGPSPGTGKPPLYNYSPSLTSIPSISVCLEWVLSSIFFIRLNILTWLPALHWTSQCIFKYSLMAQVSPGRRITRSTKHGLRHWRNVLGTPHICEGCCWLDEEIDSTWGRFQS